MSDPLIDWDEVRAESDGWLDEWRELVALRAEVERLRADAERFAWYFGGHHTGSGALVDLALRQINGDYPTLDEYRSAIDNCRASLSPGTDLGEGTSHA